MSDDIWKVTLDEITPEKLIEIDNYLFNKRLAERSTINLFEEEREDV